MTRIIAIDHIVLKSSDVERSLAFYTDALGLEPLRVEEWRKGEVRFPSVRISGATIIDLFPTDDPPGPAEGQQLDHFCLVLERGSLDEVLAKVESFGLEPGPKQSRWGAQGRGESSYVAGPEGVTIELRHYPDA
ncbi:MAG: VOC family protein [Chloroflexi bacterium]|nr:VOC family protein [Chloroflexota bacterium]MCI0778766.1 VOC family protein [Chloroflexota bacterium]MCI0815695.1 VOC family protein [Chloroflexota bacterium]MCI0821213.1 VOC family protein [Chloroflexota bacterium]MCI0888566.1 VOC family protein [Chloroflexota bacterium]